MKFSYNVSMELSDFEAGNENALTSLHAAVIGVRAQPAQCLDVINIMDKAIMTMIGTSSAISLCENDLAAADRALATIQRYEVGNITREEFIEQLGGYRDIFLQNSLAFDKPVTGTVNFIVSAMFWVMLVIAVMTVFVLLAAVHSIRISIRNVAGIAKELADGKTDEEIAAYQHSQALGGLCNSLEEFRQAANRQRELEAENKRAEEERMRHEREAEDARRAAEEAERAREREAADLQAKRTKALEDIISNFETITSAEFDRMSVLSGDLNAKSDDLARIADQTSRASTDVGRATERSAENVQAIASASEELSASFNEISSRMNETSSAIQNAVTGMHQASDKVDALSGGAMEIGRVVELIRDIAEQTNLLALNATIEAARAGDAGKGFAVVASEVKSLASQTANATTEIEQQIGVLQSTGQEATEAMSRIETSFKQVEEMSIQVSAAVEEQTVATSEITGNITQTAAATDELRTSMSTVRDNAVDTDQSAKAIAETSGEVATAMDKLSGEFSGFMAQVRAI